jgi:hypothetical protein
MHMAALCFSALLASARIMVEDREFVRVFKTDLSVLYATHAVALLRCWSQYLLEQ